MSQFFFFCLGYRSSCYSGLVFIQMGQWVQTDHLTFGDVLNIMLGSSVLLLVFPELQRNFEMLNCEIIKNIRQSS